MTDRRWNAALSFLGGAIITMAATHGCGETQKIVRVAKLGAQAMKASEPVVEAAYAASQDACLALEPPKDQECVAKVRAEFEPIKSAIKLYHDAYCEVAEWADASECAK